MASAPGNAGVGAAARVLPRRPLLRCEGSAGGLHEAGSARGVAAPRWGGVGSGVASRTEQNNTQHTPSNTGASVASSRRTRKPPPPPPTLASSPITPYPSLSSCVFRMVLGMPSLTRPNPLISPIARSTVGRVHSIVRGATATISHLGACVEGWG